jgi:hypothetical protein
MNSQILFLQIEVFFQRLRNGDYDHPVELAIGLEALANLAWDEVDELYQPSLKIE